MVEYGFVEILPKLEEVPKAIADEFREMIKTYLQAKDNKHRFMNMKFKDHIFEVFDDKGKKCCLFKKYDDESFAKKEAIVYLLDHPQDGHRSDSSSCLGLSRTPPTVFIRPTKDMFGCLIKFMEHDETVMKDKNFRTTPEEIQRVCISHIRFGNNDGHGGNTLQKKDANGIKRIMVIDNEHCFGGYKLKYLWWSDANEAQKAFSSEMKKYVSELDTDRDIKFLKKSGWSNLSQDMIDTFRICTLFLKKAVEHGLTPAKIGMIAKGECKKVPTLSLQYMVNSSDRKKSGEVFVKSALEKIGQGLELYLEKVPRKTS